MISVKLRPLLAHQLGQITHLRFFFFPINPHRKLRQSEVVSPCPW